MKCPHCDQIDRHVDNCFLLRKPIRTIEDALTQPLKAKTEWEARDARAERPDCVQKDTPKFQKHDAEKANWALMPEDALREVLRVLEFGAKKYGDYNWLDHADEVKWTRYTNALERHLKKFKTGVNVDEDSGLSELAHIACNALMLLEYTLHAKGIDDRRKPKGGAK